MGLRMTRFVTILKAPMLTVRVRQKVPPALDPPGGKGVLSIFPVNTFALDVIMTR